MKIKTLFLTLALCAGISFTACSSDDDDKSWSEATKLEVSKTAISLAGSASQTLVVKASQTPAVTADVDWLHIGQPIPRQGSKNLYDIEVEADVNPGYEPRTGNITVTCGAEKSVVAVTQFASETVLIAGVTPSAQLNPNGGSIVVNYSSTGDVVVEAPTWLTQVQSKALTENSVEFSYNANLTAAARTGEIVITLVKDNSITASVSVSQDKAEQSSDMSSTAKELAAKMFAGVNIGNTMEPPTGEGSWGAAKVNPQYIAGLKALGFNAVRVPCAWDSHVSDPATNTIDPAWLDRVDEVVSYIVNEGMYAIVNIHWDGGWLEESCVNGYDEAVDKKQRDYWTQIASKLNHYDEHLLFAGMNEPDQQDQGNAGKEQSVKAIMAYQQTFVDAVRATGGNNAKRCLIHQTPFTNIDKGVEGLYSLPTDQVADRSLVEVHFYDPSDFTLMSKDGEWGAGSTVKLYWGAANHVSGSDRNCTWGEESYVDAQFKKMQDAYVSKGVPVIVGEYSSAIRSASAFSSFDEAAWKASRAAWNEYITKSAKTHGCVPFYWETGGDINRSNGTAFNSYAIDAIMAGAQAGNYPF